MNPDDYINMISSYYGDEWTNTDDRGLSWTRDLPELEQEIMVQMRSSHINTSENVLLLREAEARLREREERALDKKLSDEKRSVHEDEVDDNFLSRLGVK